MTRSKITGGDIKAWKEGIGQPQRWLADQIGVSGKTVESCDLARISQWDWVRVERADHGLTLFLRVRGDRDPQSSAGKKRRREMKAGR